MAIIRLILSFELKAISSRNDVWFLALNYPKSALENLVNEECDEDTGLIGFCDYQILWLIAFLWLFCQFPIQSTQFDTVALSDCVTINGRLSEALNMPSYEGYGLSATFLPKILA